MSEPKRYGHKAIIYPKADNDTYITIPVEEPNGHWITYADYARLKAEVERLRKAGDAMYVWLGIVNRHHHCSERDEWLRAKKGLPSLNQQWEREKANRRKNAVKEGKPSA